MNISQLIHLMQFGDSALPVGAFTFSAGIEAAVQTGVVRDANSLKAFIQTALQQNAYCDGIALIGAHRAACNRQQNLLIQFDWAVHNRKLNAEARLMTTRIGKKLAEIATHIHPHPLMQWWLTQINQNNCPGTHPLSQALLMVQFHIGEQEALALQQYGLAMTMLSAALRLMRLSHYQTQRILYDLNPIMVNHYTLAAVGTIDAMHSYAPAMDILTAVHDRSFVRLFMN